MKKTFQVIAGGYGGLKDQYEKIKKSTSNGDVVYIADNYVDARRSANNGIIFMFLGTVPGVGKHWLVQTASNLDDVLKVLETM